MHNFYFDNSIVSRIIRYESGDIVQKNQTEQRWDSFITQMEKYFPGIDGMAFNSLISDSSYLEVIGLGRVQKPNQQPDEKEDEIYKLGTTKRRIVQPLYEEVDHNEWKNFVSDENGVGAFCDAVSERIKLFIERELSSRKLYRYALDFFRTYEAHPNAHFDLAMYKRKMKELKKQPAQYDFFCEAIFWEIIFRYPFINPSKIDELEKEEASQFWGGIMGHLFRIYYELYRLGSDLSALGICSEIHRIGSDFVVHKSGTPSKAFVLQPWKDLGDSSSIHFALIGKRTKKGLLSVNVVTCDKRRSVEQRLKCLHINLKILAEKGFKIDSKPGVIFVFDPKTMLMDGEPIDVANFLKGIDDTN